MGETLYLMNHQQTVFQQLLQLVAVLVVLDIPHILNTLNQVVLVEEGELRVVKDLVMLVEMTQDQIL
jgi:hypothetical protein